MIVASAIQSKDGAMTSKEDAAIRATVREVAGPVMSASEIEIPAGPHAVWEALTDFARWPEWNPDVTRMSAPDEPLAEGYVFKWKAGPGEITSTVIELDAPRRIVWTGRTIGIDALHVWEIEASGDGALVHTEEAYRGFVARLFRAPLRRVLRNALDRAVDALHREVAETGPAGFEPAT
jgi:uncharacterized protein YndB with AHSA1/START domain